MQSNINKDTSLPNAGKKHDETLIISKFKFKFDKARKHIYEQAIRGDKNVEVLNSLLMQNNINNQVIDQGISKINNILLNAAKRPRSPKELKMTKK